MESIIRDSMMKYLRSNSLLSDKQFGFLGGRSTVLQLLTVVDKWTKILDQGGAIDVIYCDFQKAFDTVPHGRLLDLLAHYGIKDPILSWIRDFLRNRKQTVSINGCRSKLFDVTSGVPQGSVLGPLLFIMYINSLVEKISSPDLYLYADDLKIFRKISAEEDIEKLQHNLDKMYDWTCYSLLRFHPDKCVTMRLTQSRANKQELEGLKGHYNMNEVILKTVTSEKDLGISFDNTLTFENHIYSKVNKANGMVGMIRRSFSYMDKDMFKQLFVSIVRPHLEYGAPVWNPHLKKLIRVIENVQRRASKMVPGLANLSYKERLKNLKLPTLMYRRYRGDMIETFKLTHGLYDENVSQNFLSTRITTQRESRAHQYSLHKENCKKDIRKFFFKNRVTDQWNNLPTSIINAPSLNCFKRRLDKLWERDDVMYDNDIDLHVYTSLRRTRYLPTED